MVLGERRQASHLLDFCEGLMIERAIPGWRSEWGIQPSRVDEKENGAVVPS